MKPRIAMISMHTSPLASLGGKETGGMNVYVRELCRNLTLRGWQVDVFTRWQDPSLPQVLEEDGCRVVHIAAGPQTSLDRRKLFGLLPEFVQGIRDYTEVNQLRYGLLHSHYWLSGWVARELAADWGAPIVQMFHTLGRMKDAVADGPAAREAANRAAVEQEIMGYSQRIVAATPLDRQQMLDLYSVDQAKIAVIPCGVNRDLFRPIPHQEAREHVGVLPGRELVLFVGRLDPVKGLEVLLQAMCDLTRRVHPHRARDLSLAVIGGDLESHVEGMTRFPDCLSEITHELGLDDLVVFFGSRSQRELPYYYSAAEICVMPSLYESFGMVALEAMACGTPVIASRVGGLTYTVRDGETGFLVPERDPEALADKMELLLDNDCLRSRLGHRAEKIAEAYDWQQVAEQVETVYGELGVG